MPISDKAAGLASFSHYVYGYSLPTYPPAAPRLAKIQYGSISCFGLPSFKMAARPTFHGDSGIRLGQLHFQRHLRLHPAIPSPSERLVYISSHLLYLFLFSNTSLSCPAEK